MTYLKHIIDFHVNETLKSEEYYDLISLGEWQKLIGVDNDLVYGINMDNFTKSEMYDLQNWWDIAKLASLRDPLIKQIMFPTAFSLNASAPNP